MQPASRNTHVDVGGVKGKRLQQMQLVQADNAQGIGVVAHFDGEPFP